MGDPRSERLAFRRAQAGDAAWLHAHWNRPEVRRYLWDDHDVAEATVREVLERSARDFEEHGFGVWLLSLADEPDALVGMAAMRIVDGTERREILYSVEPACWGRGYATEAARALVTYGFGELGLERVWGGVDGPNVASTRVLDKVGMRYVDTLRLGDVDAVYYAVRDRR